MLMVFVLAHQVKADQMPASDTGEIFLVTVVDTSPTSGSYWRRIKELARQAMDCLQPGDRLQLLSARPGQPVLHLNTVIDSPNAAADKALHGCLTNIHQAFFLSKADVTRAVEMAFDELNKHSQDYLCCLIVLSDGKLSDNQIKQVRRLATAYRSRKWPFLFTAGKGANRHLFIAGSEDELDVAIIGDVNLPQWLAQVRTFAAKLAEEKAERPAKSARIQPSESANEASGKQPPETEPPEKPPLPSGKTTGLPHIKEPNDIPGARSDADNSRPGWYIPAYPMRRDKQPHPPVGADDLQQPKEPKIPDKPKTKAKSLFPVLKNRWPLAVTTGGILAGAVLLLLVMSLRKPTADSEGLDQESELVTDEEARLIALSNGERFDLGEGQSINNLIIGTNPGSPVPIVDDEVEDEHFKISNRRGRFKIKNLSTKVLMVNGITLVKGQKHELLIPATIEVTKNVKISLFREFPEIEQKNQEIEGGQL
jgi:hypothetical protein